MSVEIIKYGDTSSMIEKGNAKSILATAIAVASQAKALAPVDLGSLRNSIGYEVDGKSGGYNQSGGERADPMKTSPKKGEGQVGTSSDHAIFQEFGTKFQVAQPFLRPAGLAIGRDRATATKVVKAYQEVAKQEFTERKAKRTSL